MKFKCKTIPSGIKNKIADRFVMRTLVNVRYPDKEKLDNKLGILEIKAVECTRKVQWENWDRKVPDYYYAQLLHQLCASGDSYKFSFLTAKIKGISGDSSLKTYEYEREEMQGGIDWLLDKAERFWWYVENDTISRDLGTAGYLMTVVFVFTLVLEAATAMTIRIPS